MALTKTRRKALEDVAAGKFRRSRTADQGGYWTYASFGAPTGVESRTLGWLRQYGYITVEWDSHSSGTAVLTDLGRTELGTEGQA